MAAPGAGSGGVPRRQRRMSRAELVKRWEDVFDGVGGDEAMELFMTLLLRDAQRARKDHDQEEEERRARVFQPWHPPPPPPVARVDRTVVLGLRAPPHLQPRREHEKTTTTPSSPADLGRPANSTRGV